MGMLPPVPSAHSPLVRRLPGGFPGALFKERGPNFFGKPTVHVFNKYICCNPYLMGRLWGNFFEFVQILALEANREWGLGYLVKRPECSS